MKLYPENALIMAPLSGFTDIAYRHCVRRCGCKFAFTEMVDAASIAYAAQRAETMLQRADDEDFLGVQLVSGSPELLSRAADFLNRYDFNLLDFNLGCPVPKVVKKGAGAALGRNYDLAVQCFATLAKKSRFPLTAKLRIIDSNDVEPTLKLCKALVDNGVQALTIHGRTVEHFYSGEVAFEQIKIIREAFPDINIIANGGVYSVEDCEIIRKKTGCDAVMLAQGAMGNPWLFREINGGQPPSLAEWKQMVLDHVEEMISLYGEASALPRARKIIHDYLKGRGFASSSRAVASTLSNRKKLHEFVENIAPVAQSTYRRIV